MKKKIKVKIVDSPYRAAGQLDCYGQPLKEDVIVTTIKKMYEVEISDEPDYVICYPPVGNSSGVEYIKYENCVRIMVCLENIRPDFNCFDYVIGLCHNLKYEDRYFYFPATLAVSSTYENESYDKALNKHKGVNEGLLKNVVMKMLKGA